MNIIQLKTKKKKNFFCDCTFVTLVCLHQVHSLCQDGSSFLQKSGLLGKADLEKDDVKRLETFYHDSLFFPCLLNYSNVLKTVSDHIDRPLSVLL